jgi:ketosteroid isomerase-like protein
MSGTTESRQLVERFWEVMNTNDFRAAAELFHDNYLLEWPQSGERVRGRDNFAAVNENYPAGGRWVFTIQRLIAEGSEVASEVSVTDGTIVARVITFSTVRDGKILRQTEYWPDPFQPAPWRAQWVERAEDN